MRRRLPRTAVRAVGAVLVGLVGMLVPGGATAWASAPARPVAAVAIGDSSAAGEGGGDYEPGTRGEKGDWCHRSAHAYIRQSGLAPTVINLACSGASSEDVAFSNRSHYTEGSQAARLIEVARANRVTTIVAQLGANDDPDFGNSLIRCAVAYLSPSQPGCAARLANEWPERLSRMAPKVQQALSDVRDAMRQAGYTDQDYVLVLASYPSPVTEMMVRLHGLVGCPFRPEDARWGRTSAVPQLSAALHEVALGVGARFLDLSRATEGHEACTSAGPEWERRLTVNPRAFVTGGLAAVGHLAQESFHPNATGQAQLGRCLAMFVRGGTSSGRCIPGRDGTLQLQPGAVAPPPPALAR